MAMHFIIIRGLQHMGGKMLTQLKNNFLFSPTSNESPNLRKIFKHLYVTLTLLGLFPCSIKMKKYSHYAIIRKSIYVNTLCAVTVTLTMCIFLVLHIQYLYVSFEDNPLTDGIMTEMNYVVELLCLITFCIVAYYCSYTNRYTFVKILNTMAKYFRPTDDCSGTALKQLQIKINTVMASLLFSLVIQMCVNFSRQDSYWKITLVMFTFNLPQMVQFTAVALYYALVSLVVALLATIKYNVVKYTQEIQHGYMLRFESRSKISLQQLERVYVTALEVKRQINKAFQASILVTTVQCFHSMVSESHIIYHGVVVMRNLTTHEIVNCSVWILYQIVKIFILADAGNSLKIEINNLGQALYNIPMENNDIRLMAEVQHFSTLMSYQGNGLSVYGFFPIDATLTFKVIASAAMYLIILVQFDKRNE